MNLNSLLSKTTDRSDKALLISSCKIETLRSIDEYRTSISPFLSSLYDRNVCLSITSNQLLAVWLILLDGLVSRLTIIPSELSECDERAVLSDSDTDIILADIGNINSINVLELKPELPISLNYNLATEWVLATSGTTGTPKLVVHTLKSLTNTVKLDCNARSFNWGLVYSLQRFAGLQVFLQAILSGNTLVIPQLTSKLELQVNFLLAHDVSCLSATPTLWRKLFMLGRFNELKLDVITLGGEIADQAILSILTKQFPTARVRHIYASTEAGVGFSVDDGLAGFPITYFEPHVSQLGLKVSAHNTLLLRSRSNAQSYLGQATLKENQEGFIDTGDLISIVGNRCFFKGRENGTINVGGNKVQPETVEQVLMSVKGVVFASVSAKSSPITGNLVQAQITTDNSVIDKKEFSKQLKQTCREHLDNFMVPALIKYVDDIEINATGKLTRR